ncbi:hypothetical protein CPC08DRAFT_422863 [Agrocybe pediades]|nr:hypothetical protein CPC08DRAFT_422863 [Agrocybe pediades]
MIPTLPYELLDTIFDNVRATALAESSVDVKKDFVKGTCSCHCASRAFRLRALRLLFQHDIHLRHALLPASHIFYHHHHRYTTIFSLSTLYGPIAHYDFIHGLK